MSAPGATRVAVVIVKHKAGPLLGAALDGLARQTRPPDRTIVVDNVSTDGSADGLEERLPGVEVVAAPTNLGFAAGNNLGVGLASDCEWIALLNPDAIPEPDWLEELLGAAEDAPGVAMLGSLLLLADRPALLDGAGDAYHLSGLAWRSLHGRARGEAPTAITEVFSPCAAAALYRRDAFVGAGGFDERWFCYFEDLDLAFRLRLAGHRCLLVPRSVVRHHGSALSGRESDFTIYHAHRNLVWTWARDMPGALMWRALPHHLLMTALAFAWYAGRGQGRVILRAKRDALRGLPRVLCERRALQTARRARPGELAAVMERGLSAYKTGWSRAQRSRGAGLRAAARRRGGSL